VNDTRAFGEPAECIADYAREAKADLIVMGTSGRSAIKGMLIGSVARKVLHLTHVPVMLVR
jgi:nucleotide-binding universal stress UspA family protein